MRDWKKREWEVGTFEADDRALEASGGEIWIDGKNVTNYRVTEWNRLMEQFGVVFQGAALFDSLSVYENVGMRMLESKSHDAGEIRRLVAESLENVGLRPEVMDKFPAELSGGMQKRVGIARAIIHKPRYLLYDEPTTGLDPVNSDIIDELIETLAEEPARTSIIVTHDLMTVQKIASKVAMISDRKLHFYGSAAELFGSEDKIIRKFLKRSNPVLE